MGKIADISKWQGNINWSMAKNELDFTILRVSCGLSADSKIIDNVAGCARHAIPYGVYHYCKAGTADEAKKEAQFFAETIKGIGASPSFYVLDVEHEKQTKQTTEEVCTSFIETLQAVGLTKIGMYINTRYKWAGKAIDMCDFIWIPHWGKNTGDIPDDKYKPEQPHDIWQYTSHGSLAGTDGRVDLNILTGSKPLSYFTGQEQKNQETVKEREKMLSNIEFVEYVKRVYDEAWRYWYGTCGYKCTTALYNRKAKQYPSHYTSSRESGYKKDISDGAMCADCVGMIKSFFWTNGDIHGTSKYASNNCPDKSANGMYSLCTEKGDISSIPDIPGIVVWKSGHIGVYIGNGYTIEMKGFAYDCVKAKVTDGPWTNWGKLPSSMMTYDDDTTIDCDEYVLGDRTLKKGCDGNDVKELQEALISLGYSLPKYGADGDYGSETQKAVKAFQEAVGIDSTGIFDEKTYKALTDARNPQEKKPVDITDIPEGGSTPAYVLVIEGDEQVLRLVQSAYGGTLVVADAIKIG